MNNRDKVELILDNYNELKGKKISLEYDMKLNTDLGAMEYNGMPGGKGGEPSSTVENEVMRCRKEQCSEQNKSKLKLYKHTLERIEETINNLSKEQKMVIEWLYFDGLDRGEVSDKMYQEFGYGSIATVSRRKKSALERLVSMKFHQIPIKIMLTAS